MTKKKKIWLGILTVLPFVFIVLYLIFFFGMFVFLSREQTPEDNPASFIATFFLLFVFIGLAVALALGTFIYYIIHAVKNPKYNDQNRMIWILILVLTNGIGSIIYFVTQIWMDTNAGNIGEYHGEPNQEKLF